MPMQENVNPTKVDETAQQLKSIEPGSFWLHRISKQELRVDSVDDHDVFWTCLHPKGTVNGEHSGKMSINNWIASCDRKVVNQERAA